MFIVTTLHLGNTFFLRGTIWTSERDRATTYATESDAQAAIVKSKQFNPKPAKLAKVVAA